MQHRVISPQAARKMQNKARADHSAAGSSSENRRSIPENKIKYGVTWYIIRLSMIKRQIKIQTRRLRARAHTHTHTGKHTQVPHTRTRTLVCTQTLAHARMLARAHTHSIYTVCVCIDSVSKIHYQLKHCQYLVSVHDHCVLFSSTTWFTNARSYTHLIWGMPF